MSEGVPPPSSSLPSQNVPADWGKLVSLVKERRFETLQWATRLLTIGFTILYLIPIIGNPINMYYKAFMAAGATSALRLHQRLPTPSFTSAFLAQLLVEDSCHYIFYSLIFVYSPPISVAVIPIFLFAILHFASFSLVLLDALGRNNLWIGRIFISLVEMQTNSILRMAAGTELVVFTCIILYTLSGYMSLVCPFVYYRFLTFRYASRRNCYTRNTFLELRLFFDSISSRPACPAFIRTLIQKGIYIVSLLAPPLTPQPS